MKKMMKKMMTMMTLVPTCSPKSVTCGAFFTLCTTDSCQNSYSALDWAFSFREIYLFLHCITSCSAARCSFGTRIHLFAVHHSLLQYTCGGKMKVCKMLENLLKSGRQWWLGDRERLIFRFNKTVQCQARLLFDCAKLFKIILSCKRRFSCVTNSSLCFSLWNQTVQCL